MTLQKSVFYLGAGLYVVSMLSALAMLVAVGINVLGPSSVDFMPLALVFGTCLILRLLVALWLKLLGGVPQEFRRK